MIHLRRLFFFIATLAVISSSSRAQDTIFFENFDDSPGSKPYNWSTELEQGGSKWNFLSGGGTKTPEIPNSRRPPKAYSGEVNALYFYESLGHESVILITPPVDLEYAVKPELRFRHAQVYGKLGPSPTNDELKIYYKTHLDSSWLETRKIAEFTDSVNNWFEQTVLIPEGARVPTCYLGFRATTNYGYGVCIDDVAILETGIQSRRVDNISINQDNKNLVPAGMKHAEILRIDISVKGNTGNMILNSISVTSGNSSDSVIRTDGVKLLYNSMNKDFYAARQKDAVSFVSGQATFTGINMNLPTGNTSLWIAYDVTENAVQGSILDASFVAGSININGSTYPSETGDPAGSRQIKETAMLDDFNSDLGWILSGDFQRARPKGLGGTYIGNEDPLYAAGDTMILGNDLTGLGFLEGDYEPLQLKYDNLAVSPAIDLSYYNEVSMNFLRWLNAENQDTASIELSLDNGSSWDPIWIIDKVYTDNRWNMFNLDMPQAQREAEVKIRFNLGPTTLNNHFSGWNIEDFAITGNYIDYDVSPVALLSPGSGCNNTAAETVKVKIKNLGPSATPANIPVRYSFNGGSGFTEDVISTAIPFGEETIFSFAPTVDLSIPGIYHVRIETLLDLDEAPENNIYDTVIYVDPSYSLPYYQDFEDGEDFWRPSGVNTTWAFGNPLGSAIHSAASGTHAWVTKLSGNYNDNEDSYLTGPCFNLSGINYPVFECKIFTMMEDDVDGAELEYSLNDGQTWDRVGRKGDSDAFNWEWYNSDIITSLAGNHGWSGGNSEWTMQRIYLDPLVFRNLSSVKFRFHFKANETVRYEGIGIDDIRIYDAPRDAGITSIDEPVDGCALDIGEHVVVTIKNFGPDTLHAGDTLTAGYDFAGESTVINTFRLDRTVLKGESFQYGFREFLQAKSSGQKTITAFTLLPDDRNFYNEIMTNDTASKSFEIKLTPFTNLPENIYTVRPDTLVLNAGTGNPGDSYLWQDGTTTDSLFRVTELADSFYHVLASNGLCDYRDTSFVHLLISDAGITRITEPEEGCELGAAVSPLVRLKNYGTDTIHIGDTLGIGFIFESGEALSEEFVMSDPVYPDSLLELRLHTSFDLSAVKAYSLMAYSMLKYDYNAVNDTIKEVVETHAPPSVDLGADTTVSNLSFHLDAGAGHTSYLWNDSSTQRNYTVDYLMQTPDQQYYVTVSNEFGCEKTDWIKVMFDVFDIGVTNIISPESSCQLTDQERLQIRMKNIGKSIASGQKIQLVASIDGGADVFGQKSIIQPFNTGDSLDFSFGSQFDFSAKGEHSVEIYASFAEDVNSSNDTLAMIFTHFDDAFVNLGGTDDTLKSGVPQELDAGKDFTKYLWNGVPGIRTYTATSFGWYKVQVTDSQGCIATDSVYVSYALLVPYLKKIQGRINVYPNPAGEHLNIEVELQNSKDMILEMFNLHGQLISLHKYNNQRIITETLDLSCIPGGEYYLRFRTESGMEIRKIIVQ